MLNSRIFFHQKILLKLSRYVSTCTALHWKPDQIFWYHGPCLWDPWYIWHAEEEPGSWKEQKIPCSWGPNTTTAVTSKPLGCWIFISSRCMVQFHKVTHFIILWLAILWRLWIREDNSQFLLWNVLTAWFLSQSQNFHEVGISAINQFFEVCLTSDICLATATILSLSLVHTVIVVTLNLHPFLTTPLLKGMFWLRLFPLWYSTK